jgi:F-type H+/Na+-transporting ATPase subunit beta
MLAPHIVGRKALRHGFCGAPTLAQYEELKDLIAMLGLEELTPKTGRWCRARGA